MNKILAEYLDNFRVSAAKIFAANPKLRSVMLGVSQYWADEASDAVHDNVVASERELLPLWPHRCADNVYDDNEATLNVAGEVCGSCGEDVPGWTEGWDDNGSAVIAFQPWCHEAGSQESAVFENALPCLVARKRDAEIEIGFIGRIERIEDLLRGVVREDDDFDDDNDSGDPDEEASDFDDVVHVPADPAWNDPRARELYAQVCEHPRDDAPRRVLADYLLERNVALGEFIALSLDKNISTDAKARYEHLYDTLVPGWLAPLARVVPPVTARFDRGLLSDVDVWATEAHAQSVRGHLVWNSVERIRVHGGEPIIHPAMRALRTLGPVDAQWIAALLAGPTPWAIEELDISDLDIGADLQLLRDTRLLPNLRRLTLPANSHAAIGVLATAAWWKQLERVTIRVDDFAAERGAWLDRRAALAVPWLALVQHHNEHTSVDGWELAFGPANAIEATMRGFTPFASLDVLAKLIEPLGPVKLVRSEHYDPAQADVDHIGNKRLSL